MVVVRAVVLEEGGEVLEADFAGAVRRAEANVGTQVD